MFSFLKRRAFLVVLGFVLLALFVWLAGPYFSFADYRPFESVTGRVIAIALVIGIWAGWMLAPDRPLLLVLESDDKLGDVVTHLARTGLERLSGYLAGGMSGWENAGLPLQALPQLHVADAAEQLRHGALTLLEEEGFGFDRNIVIFDGGPTVTADTDRIRTVREAAYETVLEVGDGGKQRALLATGRLQNFLACGASVRRVPRKGLCIDSEAARLLGVTAGDQVLAVNR
jgi:hypothetical protein